MKRILKLVAASALALVLVVLSACGTDNGNGYEPAAPPPDEVVTGDYLTNGYDEDFYTEIRDGESEEDTDAGATADEEPYDEEQPETDADAGATP